MRLQGTLYAIAATAAALCLLPACSSEAVRPEATTTTPTVQTATATASDDPQWCPPTVKFQTAWIEQALTPLKLPEPARFINEQTITNTDDRSMVDVIVRICGQGITGDELKDVGTDIAQALRPLPEADTIASLRVTNYSYEQEDPLARIRCENFQVYLWNSSPQEFRFRWKTAAES